MDRLGHEYHEARMALIDATLAKQKAIDLGFTTVGVTAAEPIPEATAAYRAWLEAGYEGEMAYMARHEDLKADPKALLPSAQSVVVVTLNYYQDPPADVKIARYALGRDYHKVLRAMLKGLQTELTKSYPDASFRICVDSAPILERAYALQAGLGWFGKNTMLIDSKRGSWFFIGALLTSIPFQPDEPSVGGCGTCTKCIDACPTGAIVRLGERWQVDSRSCISYQTIEKRGELDRDTNGWVFGCDVCQEVCPFNQPRSSQPLRAVTTTNVGFLDRRPIPKAEVLAEIGEDQWDSLTQGSAMRRTGYEGLKRNARAALRPLPGQRGE